MNDKWINLVIVVLLLLVVGVGAFLFKGYLDKNRQTANSGIGLLNNNVPSTQTGLEDNAGPVQERPLTSEESTVLQFPGADATQEEKQRHGDLVSSLTILSDTLDLTACKPYPIVIGVNSGSNITIVNQSSDQLEIQYGGRSSPIPANSSNTYSISEIFGNDAGDYGYSCAGTSRQGIVGIVKIINQ